PPAPPPRHSSLCGHPPAASRRLPACADAECAGLQALLDPFRLQTQLRLRGNRRSTHRRAPLDKVVLSSFLFSLSPWRSKRDAPHTIAGKRCPFRLYQERAPRRFCATVPSAPDEHSRSAVESLGQRNRESTIASVKCALPCVARRRRLAAGQTHREVGAQSFRSLGRLGRPR